MAKKKILIIDDEAGFTRMVKINLEKTGDFEVHEENRANQALNTARGFLPDLILLDVIMPSIDGGDVSAMMRKDRLLKKIPIIFLTATVSQREAGPDGLNSGGSLFLAKPVSAEILIQRIHENLPKEVGKESDPAKASAAEAKPSPKVATPDKAPGSKGDQPAPAPTAQATQPSQPSKPAGASEPKLPK